MADLTPAPGSPGLHVSKPAPSAPPRASAVCHCGASATASGESQVRALVDGWEANHGRAHAKEGNR